MNPKPWVDRLIEVMVGLVVAALLLHWAWDLLAPLVPVLVVAGASAVVTRAIVRRHQGW